VKFILLLREQLKVIFQLFSFPSYSSEFLLFIYFHPIYSELQTPAHIPIYS